MLKFFSCVKYADDTTFYSAIENPDRENVSEAIRHASSWCQQNNMILNSEKTVVLNVCFSERRCANNPVLSPDGLSIQPSDCTLPRHFS